MKLLMKIIRNIVFGIFGIYSINVLFSTININLPINLFTLSMSSFLGVFGIITIVIMKFII